MAKDDKKKDVLPQVDKSGYVVGSTYLDESGNEMVYNGPDRTTGKPTFHTKDKGVFVYDGNATKVQQGTPTQPKRNAFKNRESTTSASQSNLGWNSSKPNEPFQSSFNPNGGMTQGQPMQQVEPNGNNEKSGYVPDANSVPMSNSGQTNSNGVFDWSKQEPPESFLEWRKANKQNVTEPNVSNQDGKISFKKYNESKVNGWSRLKNALLEKDNQTKEVYEDRRAKVMAIGDALRHLGNLYYTTRRGAKPMSFGTSPALALRTRQEEKRKEKEAKDLQMEQLAYKRLKDAQEQAYKNKNLGLKKEANDIARDKANQSQQRADAYEETQKSIQEKNKALKGYYDERGKWVAPVESSRVGANNSLAGQRGASAEEHRAKTEGIEMENQYMREHDGEKPARASSSSRGGKETGYIDVDLGDGKKRRVRKDSYNSGIASIYEKHFNTQSDGFDASAKPATKDKQRAEVENAAKSAIQKKKMGKKPTAGEEAALRFIENQNKFYTDGGKGESAKSNDVRSGKKPVGNVNNSKKTKGSKAGGNTNKYGVV